MRTTNNYRSSGCTAMRTIDLTQGKIAIVDDEDYDELNKHKWCVNAYGYAVRHRPGGGALLMHRVILGDSKHDVDHIDGVRLNNMRSNLRYATRRQNLLNKPVRKDSRIGVKGVRLVARAKSTPKYQARISGKHIGIFDTIVEAAQAYDDAASKSFGEFARLNNLQGAIV